MNEAGRKYITPVASAMMNVNGIENNGDETDTNNKSDHHIHLEGKDERNEEGSEDEESSIDQTDEPTMGIPQDRGYSWIICFSAGFLQMLVFGHNRAMSTWFVDIREEFQQSQTVTSLSLSLFSLSLAVSSLMSSNVIIKLFPPRVACVVAAFGSCTAVLVASQAPHIGVWLACYILRGLSCGVFFIIPMSLIGYYFKRRRALASSIVSMGLVAANIIFPPFASILRQTFGLRGAMLLMCGIELQMIPLAMLLRPHTSYIKLNGHKEKLAQKKSESKEQKVVKLPTFTDAGASEDVEPSQNVDLNRHDDSNKGKANKNNSNEKILMYQQPIQTQPHNHMDDEEREAIELYYYSSSAPAFSNSHDQPPNFTTNPPHSHDYTDYEYVSNEHQNANKTNHENGPNNEEYKIQGVGSTSEEVIQEQRTPLLIPNLMLSCNGSSDVIKINNNDQNVLSSSVKSQGESHNVLSSPTNTRKRHRLHPQHSRISHYSSQMSIAAIGSAVDVSYVMVEEEIKKKKRGNEEDNEDSDEEDIDVRPTFGQVCRLNNFFDMSLLKLWRFRMLAAFMVTGAATNFITVYMPVLASEAGLSKNQGSLLLTIGGSVDLVTRPVIGWLADRKMVSKEKMIAWSMLVVTVITQLGQFYTTFSHFVIFTILAFLFGGFRSNLFHAIVFDYFGPQRAPKVFGLTAVCITMFMATNHPIFGALIDTTGSHVIPLHYLGGVSAIATCIMMLHPVFARLDKRNEEKKLAEEMDLKS